MCIRDSNESDWSEKQPASEESKSARRRRLRNEKAAAAALKDDNEQARLGLLYADTATERINFCYGREVPQNTVSFILDSGASVSAIPPELAGGFPDKPSAKSLDIQTANGVVRSTKCVDMYTDDFPFNLPAVVMPGVPPLMSMLSLIHI